MLGAGAMVLAALPALARASEQAPAEPAGAGQAPPLWVQLLPWVAIFVLFYFLLIRPHSKQQRERQAMLARIKKNDRVLTTGGIYGTVTSVRDDEVTLKVDEATGVRMRFARSAIAAILGEEGEDKGKGKQKG
ncbi:MAG: hypothetical protein KatS3mg102_0070 [Planctomycetota bacterium]|nr:MAG: hypothetical protein KatS3mg102_0070 [Planctomycetota bacterium]